MWKWFFHSHANKNSFSQESSLRSWRYCIVVEWDLTAEPSLAAKLREIPSTASPLLPFFGTQLRRQNFNLEPTQYHRLRRLTGKVVHLASFSKWGFLELGSGLLAWAGSQGRVMWVAGALASPSLSFLLLSYRLAFSVRFFFPRPIPNNRACSHPTSSNNTGAKKEENMSCTRLIELHSSLIYTGIMKIILICKTRQLCFITRYALTRNTVCNWGF